jgi:hypothetical protein
VKLLEFHVFNGGSRIAINPEAVVSVGEMPNRDSSTGVKVNEALHAEIKRIDGSSVELRESYDSVLEELT